MSKIDHTWNAAKPPAPDVYTTRRNESKYLTLRYWDGESWFEIAYSRSRGGVPFFWPKNSRIKRPTWWSTEKDRMCLRKISANLGAIQWGEPFKVYDEKEVLKWLVKEGLMRADWMTHYQSYMPQGKEKV